METFANFDKLSQSELVTICGGKVSTTTTTTTTTTTDGEGHSHTTTTTTTTTTITDDKRLWLSCSKNVKSMC